MNWRFTQVVPCLNPKVTPLEVTYKDRAGEVDHIVKYKRVSTRTTIFGSFKTEETLYKLK